MSRRVGEVFILSAFLGSTAPSSSPEVMSWVPPYRLVQSRLALQHKAGQITAGQWLSRLGLQFWIPTTEGEVRFVTHEEKLGDGDVTWFRTWAVENNVKILLTVYNHDGKKWNWDLAKAAFKDHQDVFVENLAAHLDEVAEQGAGIEIWDIPGILGNARDQRWGSEEAWAALKKFRNSKPVTAPCFH